LLDNIGVSLGDVVGVVLGVRSDHGFIAVSDSVDVLRSSLSESGLLGHFDGVKHVFFVVTSSSLATLDGRRRARLGLHASVLSDILSVVSTSSSGDLSSLGSPGVSALAGSVQVPGGVHHLHEVVVSVNAAGDVGVVFLEFFTSHDAVSLSTSIVMGFEGLEPLSNDLLGGHSSCHNFGVFASRVEVGNVAEFKFTVTISVDGVEGGVDTVGTYLAHGSSDGHKELLVADEVLIALVKELE